MSDRMRDVSHTHPYTGETFSDVYRRGPAVTDGGEPAADGGTAADPADDADRMRDVDHTPRDGDGARAVWERGQKRTDEDDVPDEDVANE
jgi:hypothetical protein